MRADSGSRETTCWEHIFRGAIPAHLTPSSNYLGSKKSQILVLSSHITMSSQNGTQAMLDVPVLIVGGGASGLLAAYLLSKLGG